MSTTETLYSDATLLVAAQRNLLILAWTDAPSAAQLRECGRLGRVLGRKHPGGIAMLDLLISGTAKFSNEMREEAVKITRDPKLFRLGVADVVLVSGLVGVAARAILSTVALIGRPVVPNRMFGNLADATAWLAPKLALGGEPWSAAEIIAIAEPIVKARRQPKAV